MIEVQRVGHQFGRPDDRTGAVSVLEDISLGISDGTFVSFLGPSGCGKTTLLRIIDGLIRPTWGEVIIDGRIVHGPSGDRAMVFQEFNLLPWRTAEKNVEFAPEVQGSASRERSALAGRVLTLVGLDRFGHHYPHELSGGMKQRVGLARALSTTPRYLLMDEPFGALDPQIRELMQIELMSLWEQDRKTVVFVTHSVEEAIFLSDRIVMFSARPGQIIEDIDITLPRPRWTRDEEVKGSPEFLAYRQHIWSLLKRELQQPSGSPASIAGAVE